LGLDSAPTALYCAVVVFVAYLIRGIAGFGSGLIAVPLLSLAAPVPAVVPLVVALDYVGSASQGVRNLDAVAWREQLLLIPFMVVGIGLGLLVLGSVAPVVLARVLGGFVILYAIYQWWPQSRRKGPRLLGALFGLLGGFVGALFGTGGPFYVIYLNLRGLDKTAFRATFAVNFLIDGGIRLVAYASMGLFGSATLTGLALALPVAAAALYLGGRIHLGLTQLIFVRVISVLVLGGGLTLLFKG
jgi:uncharacterized membrane protein YfcA